MARSRNLSASSSKHFRPALPASWPEGMLRRVQRPACPGGGGKNDVGEGEDGMTNETVVQHKWNVCLEDNNGNQ